DCFCHLSYFGAKNATQVGERYWELVARKNRDANQHRFSFLQLIGVSETDAQAEEYAPHAEYFFHKLLYTPQYYMAVPGNLEYGSRVAAMQNTAGREAVDLRALNYKDFRKRGFVITGSPKTVAQELVEEMKKLRVGHLLALLHFGSMPTELCKRNIDLFC